MVSIYFLKQINVLLLFSFCQFLINSLEAKQVKKVPSGDLGVNDGSRTTKHPPPTSVLHIIQFQTNMKNSLHLKLFTLLALSIFSLTSMDAQIKFGGRVGLNISKQEFNQDSLTVEPKSKFGLDLALVSEIPLGELVTVSPELHWLQKGYKIEDIGGPIENLTATLNYLELPVL